MHGSESRDAQLRRALIQLWPLPVIGALLTSLAVRYMMTADGLAYLNSARALFTDRMNVDYFWVRDPGFPLFLRLTTEIGGNNVAYLVLSGVLAGGAVAAVGGMFYDVGRPWQRLVAGIFTVTAGIYINYAGMVLQQTGAAFILALLGLNLRWIQTADRTPVWRIASLVALCTLAVYWIHIFVSVTVFLAVAVVVIVRRKPRAVERAGSRTRALAFVLAVGVAVIPAVLYQPWAIYRDANIHGTTTLESLVTSGTLSDLQKLGPVGFAEDRVGATLVLLQLPRLASVPLEQVSETPFHSEDWMWSNTAAVVGGSQCGFIYLDSGDWVKVVRGWVNPICQPYDLAQFWARTSIYYFRVGGLASGVLLAMTFWAMVRRRELVAVLLIPWVWVVSYALLGNEHAIDRYTIVIWPYKVTLAVLVVLVLLSAIIGRVWHWMRPRRHEETTQASLPPAPADAS